MGDIPTRNIMVATVTLVECVNQNRCGAAMRLTAFEPPVFQITSLLCDCDGNDSLFGERVAEFTARKSVHGLSICRYWRR
jgi:hypothetical protein